jgi:hypothetical protein
MDTLVREFALAPKLIRFLCCFFFFRAVRRVQQRIAIVTESRRTIPVPFSIARQDKNASDNGRSTTETISAPLAFGPDSHPAAAGGELRSQVYAFRTVRIKYFWRGVVRAVFLAGLFVP